MAYIVEMSEKKKKVYSRKELEALRYEGIEEQKKKWIEVYCGLGPALRKEYDELVNSNHHSQQQVQRKKSKSLKSNRRLRNEAPVFILGEESTQSADYEIENMHRVDPASNLHPIDDENSCSFDEEEYMEDDDSDEDYSTIQKMAFSVTGEPDFDSGPPEDGLEYLRRVRWEAAHIPRVKIAKVDRSKLNKDQTTYMPQIPDIVKCPGHLMPLREWEDAFLADFSKLRQVLPHFEISKASNNGKMQSFSSHHEEETFCKIFKAATSENDDMSDADGSCPSMDTSMHESSRDIDTVSVAVIENHGSNSKESSSCSSVSRGTSGNHPTLSTIIGMSSVARVTMLKKHISMAETSSSLSLNECLWLFALCAAVDTPVDADTSAALRSLLRKCASLRAGKSELDEEVVMLNILATISGRYFGQSGD